MAESDFVILNKFGGDLKIQLRIKTRSCLTKSVKCLGVKIHANIVLVTPCSLMISPLNWIDVEYLLFSKEENMLYYDTFITAILAENYLFLTKTSHSKQKKIHYSAKIYIWHFDRIKSFWKLGMIYIDPIFVQVGPKNGNIRGFYQIFFRTIATNLLILIESPNILNWKSAKDSKVGMVLGTEFASDYSSRLFSYFYMRNTFKSNEQCLQKYLYGNLRPYS